MKEAKERMVPYRYHGGMGHRKRKEEVFFLRKCSSSEKLLASQGHIGASQPIAQLRRHRNIRRAVP